MSRILDPAPQGAITYRQQTAASCAVLAAATAAALLAACAPSARAIELPEVVGLHLGSVHASDGKQEMGTRGWNNTNLGAYARWKNGFTAGAFRNSEYRTSAYAGWTWRDDADRFALTAGVITGYRRGAVLPLLVPSVRISIADRTSARLSFIAGDKSTAALHLSIERRF